MQWWERHHNTLKKLIGAGSGILTLLIPGVEVNSTHQLTFQLQRRNRSEVEASTIESDDINAPEFFARWEKFAAGQEVYAKAIQTPEPIQLFREPNNEAKLIENEVLEVRRTIPRRIPVRHAISPFSTFRLKIIDNEWAEVLPDNGLYSPFGTGYEKVYVHLVDFEPIDNLEPITVLPETEPADKQIVVVRSHTPELLLLEGNQVVMRVPVALGGSYETTNTPIGDHRISWVRASRNMPGYPGVGFSMYFSTSQGFALHDSYWWNWDKITEGFYGSSGCINLPNHKWNTLTVEGEQISVAEFVYRWISTNIDYDEATAEEKRVEWNDPGYNAGTSAVRLLVVPELNSLYDYPTQGSAQDWGEVVTHYQQLGPDWVLPNETEQSSTSFSFSAVSASSETGEGDSTDTFFSSSSKDAVKTTAALELTPQFAEIIGRRDSSFFFYDLTNHRGLAGVNIDRELPVASAIKGPILMYFLDEVDPSVWKKVPVEYWSVRNERDVPEEYRQEWKQHSNILSDLYRMIVLSDNVSTGNVLRYAFDHAYQYGNNPIENFNNWSRKFVGIEANSGMYQWQEGATADPSFTDASLTDTRLIPTTDGLQYFNNTYTAFDLAKYYQWLAEEADADAREVAYTLLSTIPDGMQKGFLEKTATDLGGKPVSKDGFVGPRDANSDDYITADAGLIQLPDQTLLVVTMGLNAGDKMDDIYTKVETIVREQHQEIFWYPDVDYFMWMRSKAGPFGENSYSFESFDFIRDYLAEEGITLSPGVNFAAQKANFDDALAHWLQAFPNDHIPLERTPLQQKIIDSRYKYSPTSLHQAFYNND